MKINLNRNFGLYNITRDTPLDLIVFLMKTTGKTIDKDKLEKKFDKVKKYLEEYEEFLFLKEDYDKTEMSKIICYISDMEEPWTKENLMKGFEHVLNFSNNFKFPDLKSIKFGSKTNENFLNYDISMTYLLCQKLNIDTHKEDTITTLKNKILSIDIDTEKSISILKNNIFNLNTLELYHIIHVLKREENKSKQLDCEKLEELSKNININYIIKKSILTNEEAVIYAAKFFNYDITKSEYPIDILNSLADKKEDFSSFELEDNFIRNFRINPKFYKLDKFWKKDLKFLYNPKTLINLKNYENIEDNETIDTRYNQDNFYDGLVKFSNIEDNTNIISFGNFNNSSMEILKVNTLIEKFKEDMSFGKYSINIEKLVNICRENKETDYTSLHKIIRFIQKYCNISDENIKKLKSEKEKFRDTIKEFLNKLNEISELLKGKEKIDDLENISIMNSILNLNKYTEDISDPELKEMIVKLPLINYKEDKFCKPIENYYSKISEDLSNIKNLKDKNQKFISEKCKYYAYTAYYYNYLLYKEVLFDLDNF